MNNAIAAVAAFFILAAILFAADCAIDRWSEGGTIQRALWVFWIGVPFLLVAFVVCAIAVIVMVPFNAMRVAVDFYRGWAT